MTSFGKRALAYFIRSDEVTLGAGGPNPAMGRETCAQRDTRRMPSNDRAGAGSEAAAGQGTPTTQMVDQMLEGMDPPLQLTEEQCFCCSEPCSLSGTFLQKPQATQSVTRPSPTSPSTHHLCSDDSETSNSSPDLGSEFHTGRPDRLLGVTS